MVASKESLEDKESAEVGAVAIPAAGNDGPREDKDAEFGGSEERSRIERKLLSKLDSRMSIMIVIYILNYVSTRFVLAA